MTRKKAISLIVSVVMLFIIAVSVQPLQAASPESDFTFSGGRITGYTGPGGPVDIPSSIGGVPVTAIGAWAFQYDPITSVTIPNSVTTIGNGAFAGTDLTSITMPSSVTTIGAWAFQYCPLTSVTIPNSVTTIGDGAFADTDLTSITIPGSVTTIANYVFQYCPLTSVTIPNSVTIIGNGAFADTDLTSITIPSSVTTIGAWAFQYCSSLKSVTIPSSVTYIGDGAFTETSIAIFEGNAPSAFGSWVFRDGCKVYYKSGSTGFTNPWRGYACYLFPDGVTVTLTTVTLEKGSTTSLTATVSPAVNTNPNVTWSSSSPSVAKVDASGTVTAVEIGTAVITATTADGCFTASCTVTVLDTSVVDITLSQSPAAGVWTNSDVTITATITDSGSGVDVVKWAAGELTAGDFVTVTSTLTSSTDDYAFDVSSNGWYTVYAKNAAGNEAVEKIQITNIEKAAPIITLNHTPTVWTNGNVTITATVTDSGSGVDVVKWAAGELTAGDFAAVTTTLTSGTDDYAFDVSNNGWYTVYAKDAAGNEAVEKIQITNIDKVAPTFTKIGCAAYTGDPVNLGYLARDFVKKVPYKATDNLSGFASSGTTSETGSFTINTGTAGLGLSQTCYITDRAGNQASITFNYNVLALGDSMRILEPIANGGVYKRNRNIPVKLAIFDEDGVQQKMGAGDLTFVLALYKRDGKKWVATRFNRTNSSTLDNGEFKLSSDGYQYNFNLNTKDLDLGEYKLEIKLHGGGSCGFIKFTLIGNKHESDKSSGH